MNKINLDANATTKVAPEVLQEMIPFCTETYGNASSIHAAGRAAKKGLERARSRVASLVSASHPEEIVFTSGGTEADNLAIIGTSEALKERGNHIITSEVEHSAVINTCKYLQEKNYKVTYLPTDSNGKINPEDLEEAHTEKTILITIRAEN